MNFERARKELDAEIAAQEQKCSEPIAFDADVADVVSLVNARLVDKIKLHGMKVDHAILFGRQSPYFGMCW